MTETSRPLPQPSELSAPHWEAARHGRLLVQQCGACAAYTFPPRHACTACFSTQLEWRESSGRGRVYSYTIIHRAPHPAFEPPYCAAIIALEEGWHMTSNLIGCALDAVEIGMPVAVDFQEFDGCALPMFRPAGDSREPGA